MGSSVSPKLQLFVASAADKLSEKSAEILILQRFIFRLLKDEAGATTIEYGLIGGLIAVVIIAAVTTVGTSISAKFGIIANNLT